MDRTSSTPPSYHEEPYRGLIPLSSMGYQVIRFTKPLEYRGLVHWSLLYNNFNICTEFLDTLTQVSRRGLKRIAPI